MTTLNTIDTPAAAEALDDLDTCQQGLEAQLEKLLGKKKGGIWSINSQNAAAALNIALDLAYNELTLLIEVGGRPLGPYDLDTLYLELAAQLHLVGRKEIVRDAALLVALQNSYHPVGDYLQSCKKSAAPLSDDDWAHIAERSFRLHAEQDVDKANKHLRIQILGAAARMWFRNRPEPTKLDTVLVLTGPQGAYKSTYWRTLAGSPFFSDSLSDQNSTNDEKLCLARAWFHEFSEVDSVFGRKESEALKRLLSAVEDLVRRPYGKAHEMLRRTCAIVGTSNSDSFAKDPTGNRRFPVVRIESADLAWVAANRDAIWAKAIAELEAGAVWWYTAEEAAEVSRDALDFMVEDPIREKVENYLLEKPINEPIALAELLGRVFGRFNDLNDDQKHRNRVINVLKSLGWQRSAQKQWLEVKDAYNQKKKTSAYAWIPPTLLAIRSVSRTAGLSSPSEAAQPDAA
ncbi:MAG: VapE domain-containing protein [Synechococcaceae cyanobacterium]|nr:VapE domain-containing protein [Synechococcaceae cyanobacterium]